MNGIVDVTMNILIVVAHLTFVPRTTLSRQIPLLAKPYQQRRSWDDSPIVLAHRGASAEFPEHTISAYQRAVELGSSMIECDMVLTSDLEVVCRHEPVLSNTTNSDAIFPHLIKSVVIDGLEYRGVFSTDLTLQQIKTLRARQRLPFRDQSYNDQFTIPTLEEYLEVAKSAGRVVGIIPEIKHSSWHNSLDIVKQANTTFEDIVLEKLTKHGYNHGPPSAAWEERPIVIQSFEMKNLRYLHQHSPIPLAQLLDQLSSPIPNSPGLTYANLTTEEGIKAVSEYAYMYAPVKDILLPVNSTTNRVGKVSKIGALAKNHGMKLVTWVMRNEERFLAYDYQMDPFKEYDKFVNEVGVDAMFTDQCGTLLRYLRHREILGPKVAEGPKAVRDKEPMGAPPWNIAQGGSSGVLPPHTVEAYQLAVDQGADFLHCDVVLTRDLQAICHEEPWLSDSTNVDEFFPQRRKTLIIDNVQYTGVFSTDLSLREIQEVRARQRLPFRDQSYNDQFTIPTLEEYLEVAKNAGRVVGIIPEIKHSSWHNSLDIVKQANTTFEDIVLEKLTKHGYVGPLSHKRWRLMPVFIQSSEMASLQHLSKGSSIPLIARLSTVITDEELVRMKELVQGLAPLKELLVPTNWTSKKLMTSTGLTKKMRDQGFLVLPYTFRNEAERYLALNYTQDVRAEFDLFLQEEGVQGLCTDFPGTLAEYLVYQGALGPAGTPLTNVLQEGNPMGSRKWIL